MVDLRGAGLVLEAGGEPAGVFIGEAGVSDLVDVAEGFFGVPGQPDLPVGVPGLEETLRRSPPAGSSLSWARVTDGTPRRCGPPPAEPRPGGSLASIISTPPNKAISASDYGGPHPRSRGFPSPLSQPTTPPQLRRALRTAVSTRSDNPARQRFSTINRPGRKGDPLYRILSPPGRVNGRRITLQKGASMNRQRYVPGTFTERPETGAGASTGSRDPCPWCGWVAVKAVYRSIM